MGELGMIAPIYMPSESNSMHDLIGDFAWDYFGTWPKAGDICKEASFCVVGYAKACKFAWVLIGC